jgi:hypothetical protein
VDAVAAAMGERISRAEFARRRGFSKAYVSKLVSMGRLAIGADGRLDVEAAERALAETADPAASSALASAGTSYASARAERERWQARLAELDYRERAGELCQRAAVEGEARAVAGAVREAVLAVAERLAVKLAATADAADVVALLEGELSAALVALADELDGGADDGPAGER